MKQNEKGTTRNEFPERGNNRLLLVDDCSAPAAEESPRNPGRSAVLTRCSWTSGSAAAAASRRGGLRPVIGQHAEGRGRSRVRN